MVRVMRDCREGSLQQALDAVYAEEGPDSSLNAR